MDTHEKSKVIVKQPHYSLISIPTVGVNVGTAVAVVISYLKWKSIGWAILHGSLGWFYIVYYILKYY